MDSEERIATESVEVATEEKKEAALDVLYPKPEISGVEVEEAPVSLGADTRSGERLVEYLDSMRSELMSRCEAVNAANTRDGSAAGVNHHNTRLMRHARSLDAEIGFFVQFLKQEGLVAQVLGSK